MDNIPTNNFTVTDCGYSTNCWLWNGYIGLTGYPMLPRNKNGTRYAHRWVYESLHGRQPKFPKYHLHHECQQRSCVNPDHLTLLHKADHRRTYNTKLTHEQAAEIRNLYATTKYRQRDLADMFSVSRTTVVHVLKNRIWRDPESPQLSFREASKVNTPDLRTTRWQRYS